MKNEPTTGRGAKTKIKLFECKTLSKQHMFYHSLKVEQLKDESMLLIDPAINVYEISFLSIFP